MWMISMKAVLDIVSQYCPDDDGSCSKAGVDLREMLDEIEGLDETKVEPVKHGKWENGHCTHCGEDVASKLDTWTDVQNFIYCPNCGSKNRMDGDSK